MTREQALEFRARWTAVNARTEEETRGATLSEKLRQLESLMVSFRSLGWEDALRAGEEDVRARWALLKTRCGV